MVAFHVARRAFSGDLFRFSGEVSREIFFRNHPGAHALPSVPMNEIDLAGRIDPARG
jgi:hypothetical protein